MTSTYQCSTVFHNHRRFCVLFKTIPKKNVSIFFSNVLLCTNIHAIICEKTKLATKPWFSNKISFAVFHFCEELHFIVIKACSTLSFCYFVSSAQVKLKTMFPLNAIAFATGSSKWQVLVEKYSTSKWEYARTYTHWDLLSDKYVILDCGCCFYVMCFYELSLHVSKRFLCICISFRDNVAKSHKC